MTISSKENIKDTLDTLMILKENKDILKVPTKIDFSKYQFTDEEKEKFSEFFVLYGLNLKTLEEELETAKKRLEQIQYSIHVVRKLLMTSKEIEKGKKDMIDFINSIRDEPVINSEKEN